MSSKQNTKMWIATADDLRDVILREKVAQRLRAEKDKLNVHRIYASLYARYVILVNKLGDIFDQTLQVQKRKNVVEKLLTAATQRMLELQNELKSIELSEFIYIDHTLIEDKFIPHDIQLLCPYYYPLRRHSSVQNVIDGVVNHVEEDNFLIADDNKVPPERKTIKFLQEQENKVPKLSPKEQAIADEKKIWDDAMNLIKKHEKARQARVLFTNIRLHPDKYTPAPPHSLVNRYKFYHKEDTPLLFPIKRVSYNDNFYRESKAAHLTKFYLGPGDSVGVSKVEATSEIAVPSIPEVLSSEKSKISISPSKDLKAIALTKLQNDSARKIQNYWFRYRIKKSLKKRKLKQKQKLGLIWQPLRSDFQDEEDRIAKIRARRSSRKEEFDKNFIRVCQDEKARIMKVRAEWIMEDISDQIRTWFKETYDVAGELDVYPSEIKGGTILVIKGETLSPEDFLDYITRRDRETPADRKKAAAEKKAKKAAEKSRKLKLKSQKKLELQEKKLRELKEGKTWDFSEPEFITTNFLNLKQEMDDFDRDWIFVDEYENPKENPYLEWVKDEKYAEVHVELRKVVDELMRLEYEQLRQAWCKDKKKKYKPTREKKKKERKRRGRRAKAKPTPIEFTQELYDKLKADGVICSYPKCRLEEYIGDINMSAYELRNFYEKNPSPSMGDVKYILRTWCLGMGSLNIKKVRSICIAGPPGCGKKFMAYALCKEMGAIMFNLSPHIVYKFKDDLPNFINTITQVASIVAPSVYFINGAHYPFIKKVTPEVREIEPNLLGKYILKKLIKPIKITNKIMLIGTTNEPWNAPPGKMKKLYEKIILCPGSDYSSTLLTWQTGLFKKCGVNREMDLSALAKVTQYYGTEQILNNIDAVVNVKRRVTLHKKPLTNEELLERLLVGPPPNFPMPMATLEKYRKWFIKVNNLEKKRHKLLKEKEKLAAEKAKKDSKKM